LPEGAVSAFTDENGRFTFKDLVPGKYRVFAVVNNLIRTNIATVEVTADKPAFVELKILPLTSLVRGQVVTNEGNPMPNAEVTLVMAKGWNTVFKVQTDANGKFEIRNLPAGLYYIIAEAKGRAKVFAGKFEFEPEKVHDGIRITLPKAATIVGKVVTPKGKPVPAYATRDDNGTERRFVFAHRRRSNERLCENRCRWNLQVDQPRSRHLHFAACG
jgi:hypothetical protein